MTQCPASTRLAVPGDVPVLASLIVTSFRQDELVYKLHGPVSENIEYAADTLYFWKKRFLTYILDPDVCLLVAEVPVDWAKAKDLTGSREGKEEWWKCLEWVQQQGPLGDETAGQRVVGFAVWRIKAGENDWGKEEMGWWAWAKSASIQRETSLRQWIYGRRDTDPSAYNCYWSAEKQLKAEYHQEPLYYLDLLTTDFRYNQSGIGQKLVQHGLDLSPNKAWPAITEASKMGYGLYRKVGFEEIGLWTIKFPHPEGDTEMVLPVMRYVANK